MAAAQAALPGEPLRLHDRPVLRHRIRRRSRLPSSTRWLRLRRQPASPVLHPPQTQDRHPILALGEVMAVCQRCGVTFTPRDNRNSTCCSRICGFRWQAQQRAVGATCPVFFFECRICGKLRTTRNRRAVFCNSDCVAEDNRRRARHPHPMITAPCAACGKAFTYQRYSRPRVLCDRLACRKLREKQLNPIAWNNARARQRHARRARAMGGVVERFDPIYVFERDHWTCGLCGKAVNRRLHNPHPLSATLDHIVPLASGGDHSLINVQLAHMICNSLKGANLVGQLRLCA